MGIRKFSQSAAGIDRNDADQPIKRPVRRWRMSKPAGQILRDPQHPELQAGQYQLTIGGSGRIRGDVHEPGVALWAEVHLVQKLGEFGMADRAVLTVLACQFLHDGPRAPANPFQGGLVVPARFTFDQAVYRLNDLGIVALCGCRYSRYFKMASVFERTCSFS